MPGPGVSGAEPGLVSWLRLGGQLSYTASLREALLLLSMAAGSSAVVNVGASVRGVTALLGG